MKKLKKIMTLLLAAVMTFTMSSAVFADNPTVSSNASPAITVTNLRKGTNVDAQTVKIYQVYNYDETNNYWALMSGFSGSGLPTTVTTDVTNLDADIKDLADKINVNPNDYEAAITTSDTTSTGTIDFTGLNKGLYIVIATDPTATGTVTYNPMIAQTYVYDSSTNLITAGKSTIVAKYNTIKVDKDENDDDNVVYIGQTLTYTIKGTIKPGEETYTITDSLEGADYNTDSFQINVGDNTVTDVTPEFSDDNSSFTLTLSNDGTYDGAQVVVTYTATVNENAFSNNTDVGVVTNKVTDSNDSDGDTNIDYTATVKLEKHDENGNPLTGAKFVLKNSTTGKYAKLIKEGSGVYHITGTWDTNDSVTATADTAGCVMDMADVSAVSVKGMDIGTYTFEEVEAPEGYTINSTGGTAKVTITDSNGDNAVDGVDALTVTNATGDNAVKDTKIGELPSTGGRGTLIFTLVGCAVMIYFASSYMKSKKKSEQ